ncbi:YegP family protein [Arthrobacter sp. ATA002]|uniref:YegP family protein n=1 Tax=Arthrobacter sp. ATA002 TaxID=2991715 RepID=UPI0022A78A94|nr:YegP family protein [Arthrobacter sp. ATA002]WAP53384.1 YegP family protein [Arthrobacter sp. ATA002]
MFEVCADSQEKFSFRLTDDDGQTLATSGPYADKQTAAQGIEGVREGASTAHIADLT